MFTTEVEVVVLIFLLLFLILLQEKSRVACITSIVYQADQVLRKYITKVIAEAKGELITAIKSCSCNPWLVRKER